MFPSVECSDGTLFGPFLELFYSHFAIALYIPMIFVVHLFREGQVEWVLTAVGSLYIFAIGNFFWGTWRRTRPD